MEFVDEKIPSNLFDINRKRLDIHGSKKKMKTWLSRAPLSGQDVLVKGKSHATHACTVQYDSIQILMYFNYG